MENLPLWHTLHGPGPPPFHATEDSFGGQKASSILVCEVQNRHGGHVVCQFVAQYAFLPVSPKALVARSVGLWKGFKDLSQPPLTGLVSLARLRKQKETRPRSSGMCIWTVWRARGTPR